MMGDQDEITLGEVGRRLGRIETALDKLVDISTRVNRLEISEARNEARAWQVRLALVVALLGLLGNVALAFLKGGAL